MGLFLLFSAVEDEGDFRDKVLILYSSEDFLSQVNVGNTSVVLICQEGALVVVTGDRLLHTSIQHQNSRISCR